jgi:hypothetical protein
VPDKPRLCSGKQLRIHELTWWKTFSVCTQHSAVSIQGWTDSLEPGEGPRSLAANALKRRSEILVFTCGKPFFATPALT